MKARAALIALASILRGCCTTYAPPPRESLGKFEMMNAGGGSILLLNTATGQVSINGAEG